MKSVERHKTTEVGARVGAHECVYASLEWLVRGFPEHEKP